MKNHSLTWLSLALCLVFCGQKTTEAQHKVSIQSKKTVLRHSKDKDNPHSETIIRYPLLSGLTDPTLLERLQKAVMPQGSYKGSLAEMKQDGWLQEVEYRVNCNQNSLLDITYQFSGLGAYPDSFEEYVTLNIKMGKRLRVTDRDGLSQKRILRGIVASEGRLAERHFRSGTESTRPEMSEGRFIGFLELDGVEIISRIGL